MKPAFREYEKLLIAYFTRSIAAIALQQSHEPKKPEGYDDFKLQQAKEIADYELHLQMYNDAFLRGGEAHAKHEAGLPIKPDGYDEHIALQEAQQIEKFTYYDYHLKCFNEAKEAYERHVIEEPTKPKGYDEYQAKLKANLQEKLFLQQVETKSNTKEGINYDQDGVPEYLTADDQYNGIQNPEWVKKHEKVLQKTTTHRKIENQPKQNTKVGINYDEDGIPEYLDAECYHFGEVNPEWLKKHGK